MMIQDTQARYLAQRAHLLADPQAHDAFAQISAFASLHVGVSAVIFLMARYYGARWLSRILVVFLVGTIVATTYLGWHFFVDDVAGLLIAVAACWLGKKMATRTGGPGPPPPDPASPRVQVGPRESCGHRSGGVRRTEARGERHRNEAKTSSSSGDPARSRPRSRNHSRPSARPSTPRGSRSSSATVRTDAPPEVCEWWAASAARLAAR